MSSIKFFTDHVTASMFPDAVKDNTMDDVYLCEVKLSLSKVHEVWKKDPFCYSGVGGKDRKEDKILGVAKRIEEANETHAPLIYITCDNPEYLQFADGRHTTAYLHEIKEEYAIFIIPSHQKETILEAFG